MTVLEALGPIAGHLRALNEAVTVWDGRDDSVAQVGVRKAGGDAVLAVDDLLRGLYELRRELLTELRESDDRSAARADALLARSREPAERRTS